MPFITEVGLSRGDIVLDADPTPPPKKGTTPIFGPCLLWPKGCMYQDATCREVNVGKATLCYIGTHLSHNGAQSANIRPMCCGQTVGWIKMPLGTKVDLAPGHIVLDGARLPLP